jgi:hypothetical protein
MSVYVLFIAQVSTPSRYFVSSSRLDNAWRVLSVSSHMTWMSRGRVRRLIYTVTSAMEVHTWLPPSTFWSYSNCSVEIHMFFVMDRGRYDGWLGSGDPWEGYPVKKCRVPAEQTYWYCMHYSETFMHAFLSISHCLTCHFLVSFCFLRIICLFERLIFMSGDNNILVPFCCVYYLSSSYLVLL